MVKKRGKGQTLAELKAAAAKAQANQDHELAIEYYTEALGHAGLSAEDECALRESRADCCEQMGDTAAQIIDLKASNRLLKLRSERGDVELAIINSVSQGLASELELDALINQAGEQLRLIFDADIVYVALHNVQTNMIEFPYEYGDHIEAMPFGEGLASQIIETGEPLLINKGIGYYSEELKRKRIGMPAKSYLGVPIIAGKKPIGAISVQSIRKEGRFNEADLRLLVTIAANVGAAIANARLFKQIQLQARRQAGLFRLSAELATMLDETEVYQRLANGLQDEALGYQYVAVFLVDDDTGDRVAQSISRPETHDDELDDLWYLEDLRLAPGAGLSERPLLDGQPHYSPDVTQEPSYEPGLHGSEVDVPLGIGGKVLGVLTVESREKNAFDEADIDVLAAASNLAAVAIQRARLYSEVQRQKEYFEALVVNSPVAIVMIDGSGIIETINPAFENLFGYAEGEAVGRNLDDLVADDALRDEAVEYTRRGVAGEHVHAVTRRRRKDGSLVDVEIQGVPVFVDDQQIGGMALYQDIRDISELDRVRAEVQRQKEYFEALVVNSPVAIAKSDSDGVVETINRAFEKLFGYAEDEAVGHNLDDLVANDALRDEAVDYTRRGAAGEHVHAVTRRCRKDGSLVDVEMQGVPVFVDDQQIGVMALYHDIRDISELDRVRAEVQRQKEYFETLVVNSPVAIVTVDRDGIIETVNPAFEELFGYSEDEAAGRNLDALVAPGPLHDEAVSFSVQAATGQHVRAIAKRCRKDGSLVDVELQAVPVTLEGEWIASMGLYYDISEMVRARQEAEAASEAKSAFLANMSHELRTPLNAIIGFTRIVQRKSKGTLPDKQVENLDKVLSSAEHLLGLINTILDLAKVEAGRIDVHPAKFDLAELVDMCLTTAQPLVKKGVKLVREVETDLPPIFSDQDKVRQILLNLLSNAAKFTQEGTITLAARREDDDLQISVVDTGIGIPEAALGTIFEAFEQADSSTTRQYGGTGLGLAISRSLAQLLGGGLAVTSSEAVGSTFTLTLPLRYGQVELSPQVAPAMPDTPLKTDRPVILAIDDDPDVIYLLEESLSEAGYQVVGAMSGDEGLHLAQKLQPLAITIDVLMPNKDGWQVLYELKAHAATKKIPVVMLTVVDKKALGFRLGAADYLVKPLDGEAVLASLEQLRQISEGPSPKRVLVVDDDPQVLNMVCQLLEGEPYEVGTAADGIAALESVETQLPDVILLDLIMPQLDGFGVVEQLRHDRDHRHIPIVVLTAKSLTTDEAAHLEESVVKVIQKDGLEAEHLIRELQQALSASRK